MDNKNGIELAYNEEGDMLQINEDNLEKVLALVLTMVKDYLKENNKEELTEAEEEKIMLYASGIIFLLFEAKDKGMMVKEKGESTVYSADSKYGLS